MDLKIKLVMPAVKMADDRIANRIFAIGVLMHVLIATTSMFTIGKKGVASLDEAMDTFLELHNQFG